jgi:hypothetical protein
MCSTDEPNACANCGTPLVTITTRCACGAPLCEPCFLDTAKGAPSCCDHPPPGALTAQGLDTQPNARATIDPPKHLSS